MEKIYYKDMESKPPSERLAELRKQLHLMLQEFDRLVWRCADTSPMILGSFYHVYKTCTKPNCRCRKGTKHGPFPALSRSVEGKRRLVMVRKQDAPDVQKKATAYKDFQKRLCRLRKLSDNIDAVLQQIRSLQLEEYP
jgi:hypothetical protein